MGLRDCPNDCERPAKVTLQAARLATSPSTNHTPVHGVPCSATLPTMAYDKSHRRKYPSMHHPLCSNSRNTSHFPLLRCSARHAGLANPQSRTCAARHQYAVFNSADLARFSTLDRQPHPLLTSLFTHILLSHLEKGSVPWHRPWNNKVAILCQARCIRIRCSF
jgi:hypothetical protein